MKIIYLLPPSEGKNQGGTLGVEKISFKFEKPLDIAINATEKDLKCKEKRYEEGIQLNKNIEKGEILPAIERYSGVMYNAIDYDGMSKVGKRYFENNFMILSGMYGILSAQDTIGNYKLPVETKGLYKFWGDTITKTLDSLEADYIVDMLPRSYAKMIDWKCLRAQKVRVSFLHNKEGILKKITHGVKKVKGEYINRLCEKEVDNILDLEGDVVKLSQWEYEVNIVS